jgi:3-dehydroquinate dehydratase
MPERGQITPESLFAGSPKPLIVAVCVAADARATADCAERSVRAGADIVEVNLAQLPDPEIAALRIPEGTPFYITCRRNEFMSAYGLNPSLLPERDDAARMHVCTRMLERGARAIDMELDTFAEAGEGVPEPFPAGMRELSVSGAAVAGQSEVIADSHARGAEVILSCHSGLPLGASMTVRLAELMAGRGADVIKIVNSHHAAEYFAAAAEAIMGIRRSVTQPFLMTSVGPLSSALRLAGCYLGNSYTFCRAEGATAYYADHPPIASVSTLWNLFPQRPEH